MAKNILVLTGSPRKNGNTAKMVEAFSKGAQAAGHTVTLYNAAEKDIKGCINCNTCFSKGTACSIADDFNELAPLVEQADMLIFATPLYWFSFPAKLKAALDKFYSFLIGKRPMKVSECALLACCGAGDAAAFDGLVKSYQIMANFSKWQDRGTVLVTGLHDKDDILATDGLERAEAFGRSLA